ncbi:hypothetical protein BH20ACI3_BH20ACI3_26020 [soil metagenome]
MAVYSFNPQLPGVGLTCHRFVRLRATTSQARKGGDRR